MHAVPLLRVRGVGIVHDQTETAVPADVSFEVAAGEVVLLLGPSGSGKSTLALATNGLIPHAVPATVTGSIEVGGADAATTPVSMLSTRVGMVFQDPDAQLVTGTVLDEVAFGPENLRLPVEEVLARAESALRRVDLWHRRAENPDRLSGGGRQRLAIACALAMGSPLLVLDEPTANLDPRGIDEVYAALGQLVAEGDRAVLLVEHNLDAAVGLVDRVVVLDAAGRLLVDGPIDAVLRERADELHRLGVWLPTSTLAALRLRGAGFRFEPLPLTPAELRAALEAQPPPHGLSQPHASDGSATGAPAATHAPPATSPPAATHAPPATGSPTHAPPASNSPPATSPPAATRASPTTGSPTHAPPPPNSPLATGSPAATGSAETIGATGSEETIGATASAATIGATAPADSPTAPARRVPVIEVRGLWLERGRTTVLRNVDLDIVAGDFVAVVGANGAGKTTLVQAIAGVVRPPRATVTVDGLDVHRTDARTLAAHVGFVFQNPEHQFIAHTVFDELAHGLRRRRLPDHEIARRVDGLLDRFGLTRHAQTHPFLLSGGEKRRLSVGTALVGGARILVLDEPTFGQDRARADELLALLGELQREGTTIVVVTHDMQLVTDYADRTIVVSDGRILAEGPTAAIYADDALIERAGLRPPPLRRALRNLAPHPSLSEVSRLADLPSGPA